MRRASTETVIPSEYFQGSPWDGCEDLAEEDLQDFMSYSQSSPWGFEDIASRIFSIRDSASEAFTRSVPVGKRGRSGGAAQGLLMVAPISCEEECECRDSCDDPRDSLASTACPSAAGSSSSLATSERSSIESYASFPPKPRLASPERLSIMSSIFAAKAAEKAAEREAGERLPSAERCGIMSAVFAAKAAERASR